jgi:N-acetylmuramoyl-L-alanine amidase
VLVAASTFVAPSADAAPAVIAGKIVFLDPGHNGSNDASISRQVPTGRGGTKDCQASGTSTDDGYAEHSFTWEVTLRVRQALSALGVRTAMSRGDDTGLGPCVDERAAMANALKPNAIVSIHADGGPTGGHGFHVIRPTRIEGLTDDIHRPSRRLGRLLRAAYEQRTGLPRAGYVGGDGLVARSDLGGLRLADVPAVFIETLNMRNAADARKAESPRFRRRIARGIADGIRDFLN